MQRPPPLPVVDPKEAAARAAVLARRARFVALAVVGAAGVACVKGERAPSGDADAAAVAPATASTGRAAKPTAVDADVVTTADAGRADAAVVPSALSCLSVAAALNPDASDEMQLAALRALLGDAAVSPPDSGGSHAAKNGR